MTNWSKHVARYLYDTIKYVNSIESGHNYKEEEINARIALGVKAYYAYQKYLNSN